jgi:valyl-tRNA synthetase
MELKKSFDPLDIEEKWYKFWEGEGLFKQHAGDHENVSSGLSYCIQLPPPNVTGTLHMGHAFQQTLMDCLVRFHRMDGLDTNWVVGTDHAGIATQLVVERKLEAEGISKQALGREKFLDRVWRWKEESGTTITKQMRRIGASANWQFASADGQNSGYFTMDGHMSEAVIEVFVQLYEQGKIYKGNRLVNWDPKLMTAVSDLEVDNVEANGHIWDIRYMSEQGDFEVVVSTTRPETMLGDVAIAVHPDDERYKQFIGKHVVIPVSERIIPIISDEYVDVDFGTGCVKITPAHDFNDYQIGLRHNLTPINILNLDGTLNENTPKQYRGLDRYDARKKILEDLKHGNALVSEKPHKLSIPKSGRTGETVEPMLTDQWFVRTDSMAQRALDVVRSGEVRFFPEHWTSTYYHWLENIQDWCISRQLWWGHRIPAWYGEDGQIFVAKNELEAQRQAKSKGYTGSLTQDQDVLDTWFSSALVPFTSLGWPKKTPELDKFLPSNVLVTGFDIIFFWVARMIMMTLEFTDKVPFKHVYINALVRDADGQKMSKSKGNTLDPLDLIDGIKLDELIEKSTTSLMLDSHKEKVEKYLKKNFPGGIPSFGTDALRFTFISLATFSRTLNFDLNRCDGYRNFCNKLWNASRFVLMNCESQDCGLDEHTSEACGPGGYLHFSSADRWISNELDRTVATVRQGFSDYRFDLSANALYKFVWDEYCDWYLEIAKVQLAHGDDSQKRATRRTLIRVLETTLRLAHPFIPFITEEIWQGVAPVARIAGISIVTAKYPSPGKKKIDGEADADIDSIKAVVTACRILRARMQISPSARVPVYITGKDPVSISSVNIIKALGKFSDVMVTSGGLPEVDVPTELAAGYEIMIKVDADPAVELEKLEKELGLLKNNLTKERAKLANAGFLSKAPRNVVEEVNSRVKAMETQLDDLMARHKKLKG